MKKLHEILIIWDEKIIAGARRLVFPFARFAIFLVYFWFGALKVFGNSPASPLVTNLLQNTMPMVTPESFIVAFGVFEMIVGLLFIVPHLTRLALFTLFIHLITTLMPLFILPEVSWQGFLSPTLEGQYMIKNVLLIALAIVILSSLHTFDEQNKVKNV